MARYQVILAYDGTDFHGFQRQHQARTIQAELEGALKKIGWNGRSILASGRTDSGVHALGQVVAFDLDWKHTCRELRAAINARLPPDAAVQRVRAVQADFHPRFDAVARLYRYRMFCRQVRDPLRERYAWRVWPAMDLEQVRETAAYLVGVHDFAAFGRPPQSGGSTVREVFEAQWRVNGDEMYFDISANAFLNHMVRRITAVLVAVGQGRIEAVHISDGLKEPPPEMFRGLAPPQGLSLVKVRYPNESETNDL
jgi:tRNA pseudouridine38-40 synthase